MDSEISIESIRVKWRYASVIDRTDEYHEVLAFLERHGAVALCQAYSFDYLDELSNVFPELAKRLAEIKQS